MTERTTLSARASPRLLSCKFPVWPNNNFICQFGRQNNFRVEIFLWQLAIKFVSNDDIINAIRIFFVHASDSSSDSKRIEYKIIRYGNKRKYLDVRVINEKRSNICTANCAFKLPRVLYYLFISTFVDTHRHSFVYTVYRSAEHSGLMVAITALSAREMAESNVR